MRNMLEMTKDRSEKEDTPTHSVCNFVSVVLPCASPIYGSSATLSPMEERKEMKSRSSIEYCLGSQVGRGATTTTSWLRNFEQVDETLHYVMMYEHHE